MVPLFVIFGKTIGMYHIMILSGIIAISVYIIYICKKNAYDENEAIIFLLLISIGVFIGGHILYSIVNYKVLIRVIQNISVITSYEIFLTAVYLVWGGSVFYGGLLGGILTAVIIFKKIPQYRYLNDIVASSIPLFHFFGRIGCFLAGCCFGIESSFGFTFHYSIIEEANNVNRFPVQLLEAFVNLLIFILLNNFRRRNLFKQNIIYLYLLFYAVARFFIEFLRGDEYRGFIFALSTSQIISMLIFCFVVPKIYRLFKYKYL